MSLNTPPVVFGDTQYAFATGVVRGKWVKRPGRAEFLRLIDAETGDIGKILSEWGFHSADENPEKAIADEWLATIGLIENLSQHPELTRLLRLFTDFTNASAAVKAEIFEYDYLPLHLSGGFASAEDLMKAASGDPNLGSVPVEVAESIRVARETYSESQLPIVVDLASDHYFGKFYVSQLTESGREFLDEYVRRWADSKNLTAYLRMRIAEMPMEYFDRFFIEGGYLERNRYERFETMELDGIPARLVFSYYGKPLADAVSKLVHDDDFEPLAKFFHYSLEDYLRLNVYISFGLEVLLAYAFLVWRELRAIGAVMRMKKAKIDRDRIIERVRYGDL